MRAAVAAADPNALVVLGRCGYDVFSAEANSPQRQFFDHVVAAIRAASVTAHLEMRAIRAPTR